MGSPQRSPRPSSWFKGVLLLRGGEGKEREGEGMEEKWKGRKESRNTPSKLLRIPLCCTLEMSHEQSANVAAQR